MQIKTSFFFPQHSVTRAVISAAHLIKWVHYAHSGSDPAVPSVTTMVELNVPVNSSSSFSSVFLSHFPLPLSPECVWFNITNAIGLDYAFPLYSKRYEKDLCLTKPIKSLSFSFLFYSLSITFKFTKVKDFKSMNNQRVWKHLSFFVEWTRNLFTLNILRNTIFPRELTFEDSLV